MGDQTGYLRCARVFFTLRFLASGVVSRYWPNTLRGGFGMALRETSCVMKRDTCDHCALRRKCAYGYLFETPIVETDSVMRLYTQAPHPFVMEGTDSSTPLVQTGQTGVIRMVLIGEAHRFLPYIFLAFQRLGEWGLGRDAVPFEITRVDDEDGRTLYDGADISPKLDALKPRHLQVDPGPGREDTFTIQFVTPLRLQVDGRITRRPDLTALVAALNRRVFLLRYFHENFRDDHFASCHIPVAEYVRIIRSNLRWVDMSRISTRQQREVPIGGVTGFMRCEGDIGSLEPLLRAGEYVHVGKNATFGLGEIRLLVGDQPCQA